MTRSFTSAATIDDALSAMTGGARPVAGGTDLVVGARQGKAPLPEAIVAIDRIDGLRAIEASEDGLRLGTLVTHGDIVASEAVRSRYAALADASAIVGSHATRAQGTIGGNVMNASPAMDTGGPLLCFGATAILRSPSGERSLGLEELWTGPGSTSARADELLVAIDLPARAAGTGSCYVRLEYRRQMEIAVVGATAVVTFDGDRVADARVAITALTPTIRRVPAAEAALVGTDGSDAMVEAAAAAAAAASTPISDVRGSAEYRAAMAAAPSRSRRAPRCTARAEESTMKVAATLRVNGTEYPVEMDPHISLLNAVRDELGLTGSKEGCDDSECGACMMLLDGEPVNSCSYLALQAEGRTVTTVEGLAGDEEVGPLQRAFLQQSGVQCGFCTPGMLVSATALLRHSPDPTEEEIRIGLSGNLCRCTGYRGIVRAVRQAASGEVPPLEVAPIHGDTTPPHHAG